MESNLHCFVYTENKNEALVTNKYICEGQNCCLKNHSMIQIEQIERCSSRVITPSYISKYVMNTEIYSSSVKIPRGLRYFILFM